MRSRWFGLLFLTGPIFLPAQQESKRSPCDAEQLSFRIDNRSGGLNGMSHSGVKLILRNNGPQTCNVPAIPRLSFQDASGKLDLHAKSPMPRFVHPGPVVVPLAIDPGDEIAAILSWVSSPVYSDSVCLNPTEISLSINGKFLTAPFQGHVCGERPEGVFYQVMRFQR